jgi:hypothetical protein
LPENILGEKPVKRVASKKATLKVVCKIRPVFGIVEFTRESLIDGGVVIYPAIVP